MQDKECVKKIEELQNMIDQIMDEKQNSELLTFPWVGNLGQWYWLVQSNKVYVNKKKVTTLGYSIEEIPEDIGFDFFTEKLHKDDYERVMENMRNHLYGKSESYEVEYRIKTKDGNYKWYYDRGKITKRDDKGKPLVVSGIVFDISKNKEIEEELKIANEQLQNLLIHDELTKVYNRRFLFQELDRILNNIEERDSFSIMLFDVDHFKMVNDKYGHEIGDIVLFEICRIVEKIISEKGKLCRWGGEEFIILLNNMNLKSTIEIANNIREAIERKKFEKCGHVTASFGLTTYKNGEDINSIIRRIDQLMFDAKKAGRNCIKF